MDTGIGFAINSIVNNDIAQTEFGREHTMPGQINPLGTQPGSRFIHRHHSSDGSLILCRICRLVDYCLCALTLQAKLAGIAKVAVSEAIQEAETGDAIKSWRN